MRINDRRARFRDRLNAGNTIWAAGAYDALSAIVIEQAGFDAVFTTGFGISAGLLGAPDIGLYTMTENLQAVRGIARAIDCPLIADGDTGYGDANNVIRTVKEFEAAGAYGITLEDQVSPKKCPLLPGDVHLLEIDIAADKIRAAVDSREDSNFLIIARTDAPDPAETMERAHCYAEAGADLIQPVGRAIPDLAALAKLKGICGRPLFIMIAKWFADIVPEELNGIAGVATFPLVALFSATAGMQQNLQAAAASCKITALPAPVIAAKDFETLIGANNHL